MIFIMDKGEDMDNNRPDFRRGSRVLWLGAALTLLYFGVTIFIILNSRAEFGGMKPNEWGDLLAGVFSPLAFLWLVIGYFQQGEELRHSANALWIQSEELRHSVEEQRDLVNVTREQLIWEKEKIEIEQAAMQRRAVPVINARPGGNMTSSGVWQRDVQISNYGPPCTMVKISVLLDDKVIAAQELSMLAKGSETILSIQSDNKLNLNGAFLEISCLDEMKNPHQVLFRFVNPNLTDAFPYDLVFA